MNWTSLKAALVLSFAALIAMPPPSTAQTNIEVNDLVLDADGERASGCIAFEPPVQQTPGFRPLDYLVVEPAADIDAYVRDGALCLQGLDWGRKYEVTVRAGIPLETGVKTTIDHPFSVVVPDAQPSVGFSGNGYILAQQSDVVLPLLTRNVDHVTLTVMRIVDRNLVGRLQGWLRIGADLDQYGIDRLSEDEGEIVWKGKVAVDAPKNRLSRTGVPLKDVIDTSQPGIHVVVAQNAEDKLSRWEDRATQWVLVSDLGITSFKSDAGLTVLVNSLATTEPVGGARVTLVARNNRVLGEITTDMQGRVDFGPGLLKGPGGAAPSGLMVYNGDHDFTFMEISGPAIDLSDRGVSGREPPGPIDAFVYGDRDIYRPGETVHVAALIRDDASKAIAGLPISVSLVRPDGQTFAIAQADQAGGGLVTTTFELPRNAPTGGWRIELRADPGKPAIGYASISVEDFVPDRLALELEPDRKAGLPGEVVYVTGTGRFLFGAPAAQLEMKTELIIERDPNPHAGFESYSFGLVSDEWSPQRTELETVTTDTEGRASIEVPLPEIADTTLSLRARLVATLLEPGGRGLTRSTSIAMRKRDLSIGIRPQFTEAGSGQTVSFDVIGLEQDGKMVPGKRLVWELVREDRRYHWERVGNDWRWRVSIHPSVVDKGQLTTSNDPVSVTTSVDWGSYRLEVYDPQSGSASSHRFRAGWWAVSDDADTPDRVLIGLDADNYRPGSMARMRIDPPYAGTALISVLGNGVLETRRVPVPKEGAEVALNVSDDWGVAGAYVSVTLLREGDNDRAPGRAVGITWLKIDRSDRTLVVDIDAPEKVRPNQRLEIPLQVSGLDRGEQAWVTLAAVDQGILSLTNYASPDPIKHYHGQRRLAVELRDSYGRLIDPAYDRLGRLRSGGDAMARQNAGLDVDAYESVALFTGAVPVDADGRVNIALDLPDFNGALRLMAVATTVDKVGSGEAAMLVRAPLVAELSRPRFLAPGDSAELELELYNLEGEAGATSLSVSATGSVSVGPEIMVVALDQGERAARRLKLTADRVGTGQVTLRAKGPGDIALERKFEIAVRPPQAVSSERRVVQLFPGKSLIVDSDLIAGFLPDTRRMSVVVGAGPTFDLPRLIGSLSRYPYGCLEQTISTTLPLLYLTELSDYVGLDADVARLRTTAQRGIRHLLTMQRSDGSFGLWSSFDEAEPWLTVYALDFMTRARAEGFVVSDGAYNKTKQWVAEEVIKRGRDARARPYALYALARAGDPDPSAFRYWAQRQPFRTNIEGIAFLAAGVVMGQVPQTKIADISLNKFPLQTREWWSYDYGSTLRDAAMQLVLLSEIGVNDADMFELAERISRLMSQRPYLSTQEMAWLSMAGKVMIDRYGSIDVVIDGKKQSSEKPIVLSASGVNLENGIKIENRGDASIAMTVLASGVPIAKLPADRQGFSVSRSVHQLDGTEVKSGTPLRQGDRFVIVMKGETRSEGEQKALLVDLLPAGLEIENTRLTHGGSLDDFTWVGDISKLTHMELRDDRFVAAIDLDRKGEEFRLAYLVRAVTPGRFVWPAAYIEDMYRPDRFARGKMGVLEVDARR